MAKTNLGNGSAGIWGERHWFCRICGWKSAPNWELPNAGGVEANQAFSVGTWLRQICDRWNRKTEKPNGSHSVPRGFGAKQLGWQLRVTKGKLDSFWRTKCG